MPEFSWDLGPFCACRPGPFPDFLALLGLCLPNREAAESWLWGLGKGHLISWPSAYDPPFGC